MIMINYKRHLAYLRYIYRHKKFVFLAGLKTKAPIWRLLIHDWTKLLPKEWFPYAEVFYNEDGSNRRFHSTKEFDSAWNHHIHWNKHHWQYWVLIHDNGTQTCLEMPELYVREMVADWLGAGKAITGKWGAKDWYAQKKDGIKLHKNTAALVERLLDEANI